MVLILLNVSHDKNNYYCFNNDVVIIEAIDTNYMSVLTIATGLLSIIAIKATDVFIYLQSQPLPQTRGGWFVCARILSMGGNNEAL